MGFGGQWGCYTDLETGLQLMTNRYYDSGVGRFLTRDPIGYKGGVNLYGFVGNNPVNAQDPSGLQAENKEDLVGEDEIIRDFADFIANEKDQNEREIRNFLNRGNKPVIRTLNDPVAELLYGARPGEMLPGRNGVALPRPPTIAELENLQEKHNVEFALIRRYGPFANGKGSQYFLYSGTKHSVTFDRYPNSVFVAHTQPNINRPSEADMNTLYDYYHMTGQRKSVIVTPGSGARFFRLFPRPFRNGPKKQR